MKLLRVVPTLALLAGCAHAALPPASPSGPARAFPLPLPPWQRRTSVADGYEAKPLPAAPVLIRGATLLLATGKTLVRGTILLDRGKIVALAEGDLPTPAGAKVIDGTGKYVTPGLIDTHSHLGVFPMIGAEGHQDVNEMTAPATPEAQTVDAFWTQDPGIERAVAGGVTTIQVLPGSANVVGGRAITLKLRPRASARAMHMPGAPDGLKMACGENPPRLHGRAHHGAPLTRMGSLALQRAAFGKAHKLKEQWATWTQEASRRLEADAKKRAAHEAPPPSPPSPPPDRDPGIETLAAALEGRVLVHVHCYRADDMMAQLALADEFGFQVRSFHHALEAYKVRDVLAARGIAVSTWADWWGMKMEAYDGIPENAALVQHSGGRAVIHSDSDEGVQRLNQEAAKALASGQQAGLPLTPEDAIRWVTLHPAWALGIQDRVGSLEPGKDADVVLWNRDPLSVYAVAEKVWIDGVLTYERGKARWSDFEIGGGL